MSKLLSKSWFRFISLVLIHAFLMLDLAWAGNGDILSLKSSDCLSPALQINSNILTTSFSKLYYDELFPGIELQPLLERLKQIELAVFDLDETLAVSGGYVSNRVIEGLKFLLKNKV
ncbi:MAG: hypothetical protein KKD05_06180, partial [Candidatus Omnitrophica bacterium]|nr:hypothetical protein [Candidatus Omnitrophota bacterium]